MTFNEFNFFWSEITQFLFMQAAKHSHNQEYKEINNNLQFNESLFKQVDDRSMIMTIYVYQPCVRIRHIKLNAMNSISILGRVYPCDSIYIFKGQILDISKTFFDYRISNENKIVLISPYMTRSDSYLVEKWIKITNDYENFDERISISINKNSRTELSRIKDIKFFKLEIKRKKFDKFIKKHAVDESDSIEYKKNLFKNDIKLNIDYDSIDSPLTDPLPVIW